MLQPARAGEITGITLGSFPKGPFAPPGLPPDEFDQNQINAPPGLTFPPPYAVRQIFTR